MSQSAAGRIVPALYHSQVGKKTGSMDLFCTKLSMLAKNREILEGKSV